MMRSLTAGLGALTILAVTGAVTTSGQTFLGFKPSSRDQAAVTVIKDTPADPPAVPAAKAPAAPGPASPAAARPAPAATHPAVAQKPAAPAASGSPIPGGLGTGLGQVASVANILLNLPQVLTHPGQGGPAPGAAPWNTPYVPRKGHGDDGHDH